MIVMVEQINAKDACSAEQATKNQDTGLIWVDSLKDIATNALR